MERHADNESDRQLIDRYEKYESFSIPLIAKAYEIVVNSLTVNPRARVKHILDDETIDERTRIQDVIQILRKNDGAASGTKIGAIERDIGRIPPATVGPSALYLLTALTNFNGILSKFGRNFCYSDERMSSIYTD